jgi:hypothetical protein
MMTSELLDDLADVLRGAVNDPGADAEELSRAAGLVLLELQRIHGVDPVAMRRHGRRLWADAQERSQGDPQAALREHAYLVLNLIGPGRRP